MKQIPSLAWILIGLCTQPASATLQFTNAASGVTANLTAAAYDGQSKFLAVGTNSTVTVGTFATDHIQWAANAGPGSASLLCATYGNGLFLVGGVGGHVFTTTDGTQWGQAVSPFPNSSYITGVSFSPRASSYPCFVVVAQAVEIAYSNSTAASSWTMAQLNNNSFIESFRAVTALGTDGFAACGIGGDIRASSDGGAHWSISSSLNMTNPDLYAIDSNGTNRLVAAGARGALWYSPDGGTSWTRQNPVGNDLNAVAYDTFESCWVACGNQGTVLTSTNGIDWIPQSGLSGNFHGAAFAGTGSLQGVGVLVGDAGNIVLAGSAPPPPTSLGDIICCECSALEPMQVISNSMPANPLVAVDWYATATGGNPVATNTLVFYPPNTNPAPTSAATNIYYAQTRDLRTGFTSSTRTKVMLVVAPRPTASVTVSGPATICNGDSTSIQAVLTGTAPWLVTWASNGVDLATHAVEASPDVLAVSPADPSLTGSNSVAYTVTALSDAYCGALAQDLTNNAAVTVSSCPSVTTSPLAQTAEEGSTVRFQARAKPSPPGAAYQWFFDGTNTLAGATNPLLELSNVQPAVAGAYVVVVTNLEVAMTSAPAMLSIVQSVPRRVVPAINLNGDPGTLLHLDCADESGLAWDWKTLGAVNLTTTSQYYFDVSSPLPPQRLYRAWQTGAPTVLPWLTLPAVVPAITLTGNIGDSLRIDCINQFGPTDAWWTLATVTLTNTSQLYFDTSSIGQPPRLWRIVPLP